MIPDRDDEWLDRMTRTPVRAGITAALMLAIILLVWRVLVSMPGPPSIPPPCPVGERTLAEVAQVGNARTGMPSARICACPPGHMDVASDGVVVHLFCDRRRD